MGRAPGSAERPIVFDARWISQDDTGTLTATLLEGLAEHRPAGWAVWGPTCLADRLWPGAAFVPATDPSRRLGRVAGTVPAASLVVHPRPPGPAHRHRAATFVLDLVGLQHPSPVVRRVGAARLRLSLRSADVLFTISDEVRDHMAAASGIDPSTVTVLRLPVDDRRAFRIADQRTTDRRDGRRHGPRYLVAVGRFAPHKNHARLLAAFAASHFAASGGQLHLFGGDAADLAAVAPGPLPHGVVVRGPIAGPDLEAALVGALGLIQPSLHEGYGLPVTEALLAGVPVTSSPIPAVTEAGPAGVPQFDPRSTWEITAAIDDLVHLVDAGLYWSVVDRVGWMAGRPTPRSLAAQVLDRLDKAVAVRPARAS